MALSSTERAILATLTKKDRSGGEAYSQWQDDPAAHWVAPGRRDGTTASSNRAFPLPKANKKIKFTRGKPTRIPATRTTSQDYGGRYT